MKLPEICTQKHKQNTKILNMRNTLKEDIQNILTEAGLHTDMGSTQQHKKKFPQKGIYERLHVKLSMSKVCTKEHNKSEPVSGNNNDDAAMPPKTKRM